MGIKVVFDGPIARDHRVSMRTLALTYTSLQGAVDRAYLDIQRGGISKYERMHKDDYKQVEMLLTATEQGSVIKLFQETYTELKDVYDWISRTISEPYQQSQSDGEIDQQRILQDLKATRVQALSNERTPTYRELISKENEETAGDFGNRSISKNISTMLVPVKKNEGENSITLTLSGNQSHEFYFDKRISQRFTRILALRDLGPKVRCEAYVIKLSNKNWNGTVRHVHNGKEAKITFATPEDFNKLIEFQKASVTGALETTVVFDAFLIKEHGTFDPICGDLYFIDLVQ